MRFFGNIGVGSCKQTLQKTVGISLLCLSFVVAGCTLEGQFLSRGSRIAPGVDVEPTLPTPPANEAIKPACEDFDFGENTAKKIFRSIGPLNPRALSVGEDNGLTIVNSVAVFHKDLPEHVGQGDVIQYDTNGDTEPDALAFIYCRDSAKRFLVRNAAGGLAANATDERNWAIYRAYTSIKSAESATENTGIHLSIRNFDSFVGGKDISSATGSGEQWNFALYDDALEVTTEIELDGWTTTPQNYLRFFTPVLRTEVGMSQRHVGAWSNTGYTLQFMGPTSGFEAALWLREGNVRIEGLKVDLVGRAGGNCVAILHNFADAGEVTITQNIFRFSGSTSGSELLSLQIDDSVYTVVNNILFGPVERALYFPSATAQYNILSNTLATSGGNWGVFGNNVAATTNFKNNIVVGSASPFSFIDNASASHNVADADLPPGAAAIQGLPSFLDSHNFDFRLASNDTFAKAAGVLDANINLARYDIMGLLRGSVVDVGAHQVSGIGTLTVLPQYPISGANWADFVKSKTEDIACNYDVDITCVHAGELKKVIIESETSCDGLDLIDSSQVFEWQCRGQTGTVEFLSIGLRPNRGLKHLVTADAWKRIHVTLLKEGKPVATSQPAIWWGNTVKPAPYNGDVGSSVATLDASNGFSIGDIIVVANSQFTQGYRLRRDKMSLVVLNDAVLSTKGAATNPNFVIDTSFARFSWVEGNFNAMGETYASSIGIYVDSAPYSTVRNVQIYGSAGSGLHVGASSNTRLSYVKVYANAGSGLFANASNYLQIKHFKTFFNSSHGMALTGAITGLDLHDLHIWSNSGYGLRLEGSNHQVRRVYSYQNNYGVWGPFSNSVLWDIFVSNNTTDGIALSGSGNILTRILSVSNNGTGVAIGDQTTLSHVASINNGEVGYFLWESIQNSVSQMLSLNNATFGLVVRDNSNSNYFADIMLSENGLQGISISNTSTGNSFKGKLLVSNNNVPADQNDDCSILAGNNLTAGSNSCETADAQLVIQRPTLTAYTFFGIAYDDRINTDTPNLDGSAHILAGAIEDWSQFATPFRSWGLAAAGTWIANSNSDYCAGASTCAMWDWRLLSIETVLRNSNGSFVSGGTCPASVNGDVFITDQQTVPNTYLKHAYEVMEDEIGDEDGLCESNEACIYSPNLGVYQGEGDIYSQPICQFVNGTVSNVQMYAHPYNGKLKVE